MESAVLDLVLTEVRSVLGSRGQAAPVDDRTIRVTYRGGGFQLLDIAGFATDVDAAQVHAWASTMLTPASTDVPSGLMPVIWAQRGTPQDAFTVSIGTGLVLGILRDEVPVGALEAASWGAEPDEIVKAARRELASHEFTPTTHEVDGQSLTMLQTPPASANAWALFPTLLKSATGVDDRQVVFIPAPDVCCVVAAPRHAELEAAQQWAAVHYAKAERPVSPAAYVMDRGELVRWNG